MQKTVLEMAKQDQTPLQSVSGYWGIACPSCGLDDDLLVSVIHQVRLCEDGTEDLGGDEQWDDRSAVFCQNCTHRGVVGEFYTAAADRKFAAEHPRR